ncbi:hypothetical protein [Nibrella saemangeumensis]|uniref:hypothetical protein n=1 Tax=Nibrella saemangeumensis TaxID=1084526 RepID=UPI0031E7FCFE
MSTFYKNIIEILMPLMASLPDREFDFKFERALFSISRKQISVYNYYKILFIFLLSFAVPLGTTFGQQVHDPAQQNPDYETMKARKVSSYTRARMAVVPATSNNKNKSSNLQLNRKQPLLPDWLLPPVLFLLTVLIPLCLAMMMAPWDQFHYHLHLTYMAPPTIVYT